MKKKLFTIAILTASILSLNISCSDDFVDTKFYQEVEQKPLTALDEIQSFTRGAYASMRSSSYYGGNFLAYGEVRSDEMYSNKATGRFTTVQDYTMLNTDSYASGTWNQIYTMIAKTNIVINTDISALKGDSEEKESSYFVQGQAYALRALGFFDLLRLYGQKYTGASDQLGIVIPTKYDPKAKMPRSTITETENQIESDFNKALELMNTYSASSTVTGKTDLSLSAVKALVSRYYLYKGEYAKVRTLVDEIRATKSYSVAPEGLLVETFKFTMNGAAPNSIFELAVGINSSLGVNSYRNILNPGGYGNLVVKDEALEQYSDIDIRKSLVRSYSNGYNYITGKYTNEKGADNIKVIRYEEVILDGVEAELNGGSTTKALEYYNELITQRGLKAVTTVTLDDLKAERSRELLGEGFRQWDLLRWGDTSFVPEGKIQYLSFPIPNGEIVLDGSLIKQNPGY